MTATPATDELLFATDAAGIARVVLNRPQARNALTFAMYRGLIACCEAIAGDTLGNCLSQGNLKRLSGLIGPARVKDILFTARLVGAEEALAIGLVGEVVPDRAALTHRVDALATLLAGHAPLTMQATKEGLRRLAEEEPAADRAPHPGDDLILTCYMSADFREGMEAFLGKRAPNWTGR